MTLNINNPIKFDYIIYTDGACIGNPGPGGWAAIIFYGKDKNIISGFEKQTTNNRMICVREARQRKFRYFLIKLQPCFCLS